MLLLIAGTIVIRRTRRAQASPLVRTSCVTLIALVTASAPARASQNPAAGGFVLVTERAGTTVAKIDVDTDQIIGRATVGNQPSDLAADHLRRWVYVAANLDHKIVAMKADTLETADLNIPGLGKLPIGVEITPDGGTLLVTTRGSDGIMSADDRLDVIRLNASSWPPTGSLIASISTGLHPIGACLARDGRHAVITVRNQPAILIVDLQTNQIVGQAQNLPLDAEPEGCDTHPTANVVYVTLHGPVSTVEVFDLDTLTLVTHVPIVHTPPARPSTGVFTPDGRRFYVSGQTVNKVFLFETADPLNPVQNMAVQLPVGQQPHFIAYLPGDRAYVANTNNEQPYGSLAIIHGYSAVPTVSGPILTTLAGPLRFVKFSSPGSGDFDSDGDVDADDAARFETCFTGANGGPIDPGCEPGDFDLDNDADCDDWAQFGLVWTGPGQPPQLTQCSSASIPTVSHWGLVTLTLLLLTAGTVVTRQTRRGGTADRVCATAL
jgi:DNA-binding beta-propeller fold protein YncE